MNKVEKIPAGYKKTEIGVIPDDWEIKSIEDLTPQNKKYMIVDGPFGSNLKTIHYRKSGIPIITSGYVTDGKFSASEYLYVDVEKFRQEKRSAVKSGDIVMAKIGERCGASAVLPKDHKEGILSGNALKITIDEDRFSALFISQILWRHHDVGYFEVLKIAGAQPAISMANLKKYKIPIPKFKAEQTAIATVLSDTDVLIEHLEKLIAKKRAIKQGTVQQLLTGKKRLLGFSGEWEVKKLGEVGDLIMGQSPPGNSYTFNEKDTPLINGAVELKEKGIFISKFTNQPTRFSKKGDLLFCIRATIGNLQISDHIYCLGRGVASLRVNEQIDKFYVIYQLSNLFKTMLQQSEGGVIKGLRKNDLADFVINIPKTKEEQTAIATILSDMDGEIGKLEQKLSKYRQIKTGMMQQLLTGKIRLGKNKL